MGVRFRRRLGTVLCGLSMALTACGPALNGSPWPGSHLIALPSSEYTFPKLIALDAGGQRLAVFAQLDDVNNAGRVEVWSMATNSWISIAPDRAPYAVSELGWLDTPDRVLLDINGLPNVCRARFSAAPARLR